MKASLIELIFRMHSIRSSAPPHLPALRKGSPPWESSFQLQVVPEYLFSCFSVFWSVAVINEIKGEPHSLSLPLPTHINLNANSLRKIKINYAFCSRLRGKWKCTELAFPFSPLFFGSAKKKQSRKIWAYASKSCIYGCFFLILFACLKFHHCFHLQTVSEGILKG